jgi:FixJ family two-component response regulator
MSGDTDSRGEVLVMGDDVAIREALTSVLQDEGYDVVCFADAAALLSSARACIPACIFIEVHAPGTSGLDILRKLRAAEYPAPVFIVSAQADIPMAVDAIKSGASDFIEKPFCRSEIVARVRAAGDRPSRPQGDGSTRKFSALQVPGRAPLTRREQEVLARLAAGASNKEAAQELGLSSRTIEGYRASIMKKVGAKNAVELIRRIFNESRNH